MNDREQLEQHLVADHGYSFEQDILPVRETYSYAELEEAHDQEHANGNEHI